MNLEQSLGFSQIKERIIHYCKTKTAKKKVLDIVFDNSFEDITLKLRQTYQMRSLLMAQKPFPNSGFIDMSEVLQLLNIKNSCIELENLPFLKDSLQCIKDILAFIDNEEQEKIPDIKNLIKNIDINSDIVNTVCHILPFINNIIDDKGNIKPDCSPVLMDIYSKKESKKRQIEITINQIMMQCKKNGFVNQTDEVSIRNDTVVVPIKASYKRNIKGILHDSSQTGQTFYIEPQEIVELNFEIKELLLQQQREIHRILTEFSDLLRKNLTTLLHGYEMLVQIDFIRAKALYAIETNATMPQIMNKPICLWYNARHPILESALKQKGRQIIPLNIELNNKQRILVISGPNAGGKSVCLKTLALLQYMLQCGLLVPMKEVSIAGIFEQIFLSIGDEQSLSDGLSTYSSHLKNLALICEKSNANTLFLIDELGTGTDPQAGGAIAESILEYLNSVNAFGVVTTHYSVLKHLAFQHENIINAAMLFDTKSIQPLYTLTIGTPGSSFAFEIAKKTGLNHNIIDNAKKKLGMQSVRFEEKLQQIEVNKIESEKHLKNAKQYDEILYQTVQKYKEMSAKLEKDKKEILNTARNQAKEILASANRQIEHAIEEIKTKQAQKQTVKKLKEQIKDTIITLDTEIIEEENSVNNIIKEITNEQGNINNYQQKLKKQNIKIIDGDIMVNDYVLFPQNENIGIVISCNKNKLQIDVGNMRIQTSKNNVLKIDKQSYLKQIRDNNRNNFNDNSRIQIKTSLDLNKIRQNFNEQLDLRGYRGEEALSKLEKFIDDAIMLGEKHIKILHGKGDGILKTLVRNYLNKHIGVTNYYAEDIRFGGEGITIAELS